jgi:exopolysaccharide biosynthesis protein
MQNKKRKRVDIEYKARMIVFGIFLIIWSCVLIFWVRIFERWDRAQIIAVRGRRGSTFAEEITYIVDEKEYTAIAAKNSETDIPFEVGEWIDYQVSNPYYVIYNRVLPLIVLLIADSGTLTVMIGITVNEFKKMRENPTRFIP